MPRMRVDIKWNVSRNCFFPFDETTGNALASFSNLTFGDIDTFPTDDPAASSKTISQSGQPLTAFSCKGYVTI